MPRKPKQLLKNLHKINVLVNDRNAVSKYFKVKHFVDGTVQPVVNDIDTDTLQLPNDTYYIDTSVSYEELKEKVLSLF